MSNRIICFVYLACFALLAFACKRGEPPLVIATYDSLAISMSDFERAYFQYWQVVPEKDTPELRKRFIRQMIEQQLIGQAGLRQGMFNEKRINAALQKERDAFVRRRYLEVTVEDTLTAVSEAEIDEALGRQQRQFRVRQVYAASEEGIQKLAKRLENGEDLEALARETMPDEAFAASGGDMGWVGWGDTDPPVEDLLYDLPKNTISKPVASLVGWHIFRIESTRVKMEFNASGHPLFRRDTGHQIFNRRLDMAAADHLREIVWQKELAIRSGLFRPVWDYIEPLLPKSLKERSLKGYQQLEQNLHADLASETLAWVDGQPFTVQEFVNAIPNLPRDQLRPNLKKAIETAIRDKIVTEHALAAGFDKDPVVVEKLDRSRHTYRYYATIAAADSAADRRVNLQQYYKRHSKRYIKNTRSEIEEILVKDRDLALDLAKQIQDGADFADLAEKYSLRRGKPGGKWGFVSDADNPLGKRAAKLRTGNIYAPVETRDGYSVIRVGKQEHDYLPFEELRQRLARDAQRDYYDELHSDLLPAGFDPSRIVYNEEILSKAFTEESTTVY